MDPNRYLPLTPRDFLILLVLTDVPLHGYGILAAVEARTGDEVKIDPANLYRSVKRLHRNGIVEETDPPGWFSDRSPLDPRRGW